MLVASDEATSGSVMQNDERIPPASSGSSHSVFWAGVPNCSSSSMLPVSGAEQFIATGASLMLRPLSSAMGAYWRLLRPGSPLGRNRFHSPRALASSCSSRTMGRSVQTPGLDSTCSASTGSAG